MDPSITTDSGPIERKVQLTGGSTYTVSIPKGWADDRDIGSGSRVYLYPFADRLVVAQPEAEDRRRTARINVDAVGDESIAQRVEAAYAAGSDEITIESDTGFSSTQRRLASGAVTGLVGMEVARETERELVARSLLDPTEVSLDGTIDQLRQISLSMHENALEVVLSDAEEAEERAAHVSSRDNDADRLFALVSRQFYRVLVDVREVDKLNAGRQAAFTQFRIARQLERIADHAELVAELGPRQDDPPDDELAARFREVATEARRVVRTALDGNTGEAILRRDGLVERLDAFDRDLYENRNGDAYLYGRVLESIRRTAEYGGNIAEIKTLAEITRS